jgi:hypothetical protein
VRFFEKKCVTRWSIWLAATAENIVIIKKQEKTSDINNTIIISSNTNITIDT